MLNIIVTVITGLILASGSGNMLDNNSQDGFSLRSFSLGNHPPVVQKAENQNYGMAYDTQNGYVEFYCEAIGTVGIFTGSSNSMNSQIDLNSNRIALSLDLNTLKTGIAQRDPIVYSTLDVDQHPTARFTGSFEPTFDHFSSEKQPFKASGLFSMHGVTRELEFEGYLRQTGDGITMTAEWILSLDDFGITPPRIFNVLINGEQEIRIEATHSQQRFTSLSASR